MLTCDLTMSRTYVVFKVSSCNSTSKGWKCLESLSDPINRFIIFNVTVTLLAFFWLSVILPRFFFKFFCSCSFDLCNLRVPFGFAQAKAIVDCLNCVRKVSDLHFFNIYAKRRLVDFVLWRDTLPSRIWLDNWESLLIEWVHYLVSVNWKVLRWFFTIFYFMQCLMSQTWHLLNWWNCSLSWCFIRSISLIVMLTGFWNQTEVKIIVKWFIL